MTMAIWQLFVTLCVATLTCFIWVTSQRTVVSPAVKTTSHLEQFCRERLQVPAWGHEGIPAPWAHGEEVALSSCATLTEDNRQSQPNNWWSCLHYGKVFWQGESPFFLQLERLFLSHEFLAFVRRQHQCWSGTGNLLWQHLIISPIKLSEVI